MKEIDKYIVFTDYKDGDGLEQLTVSFETYTRILISDLKEKLDALEEDGATRVSFSCGYDNESIDTQGVRLQEETDDEYVTRQEGIKKREQQLLRDQETQQRYMYEQLKKKFDPEN